MNRIVKGIVALGLFCAGLNPAMTKGEEKVDTRVFELRTYTAPAGKIDELHARFRNHTVQLFEKHKMEVVGFWKPIDEQQAQRQLVYLLAFPSREAAAASWKDFQADPEWKAVKAESEKNGKLVEKVDSVYLTPTDYGRLK